MGLINLKIKKKAQTNKVFVYLLSIILILFAGFLVTKFIISFDKTFQSSTENKLFKDLKVDFSKVYKTYGSEKVIKYRVPSNVKLVCFISNDNCINDLDLLNNDLKNDFNISFNSGDNIATFGDNNILNTQNIGNFIVSENNGCYCIKPKNNIIQFIFENNRNKVYLKKYE